jgi:sugar lactone lactonase YvrE
MPRPLWTERRHLQLAHCVTLIFVILTGSGFARIAADAPPVFLGTFTHFGLCSPRGVDLSPSGDVFVGSDCQNPHMQRFTAAGGFVTSWGFPAGYLGSPNGVAIDGSGNVFVTDYELNRVYKFTNAGALVISWATAQQPVDVVVDGSGNVLVLALGGQQLQKFTNDGVFLGTIGSAGSGPGQFQYPEGLALDASGRIYVADFSRRILRFLPDGSFDMEFTTPASPLDMAVGPDGNIYVITGDLNQIYQYSPSGVLLSTFSSPVGMDLAFRIAISPTGVIYIAEQRNNRVQRFQIDTTVSTAPITFGRLKAMYR